jgi:hypothetical protein
MAHMKKAHSKKMMAAHHEEHEHKSKTAHKPKMASAHHKATKKHHSRGK